MTATASFEELTPTSFLLRSGKVYADRCAVIDDEREFSYSEFLDRCLRLAGAPQRGAGAPLAGMRPRRHTCVPRMIARPCLAPGSHPTMKPLEPAPPYAGHFVGRLAHIRDMSCATLRVINPFWLQRTRGSLCYRL